MSDFEEQQPLPREAMASMQELAAQVVLPDDPVVLHEIALKIICSRGCPSYLTPYGSVRSIAAFALGLVHDPFYADGEVLLKVALAQGALEE